MAAATRLAGVAPDEYTMEEFGKLLEALPLDRRGTWRAHTILGICGYQGARQHAVLHLQWADVDWPGDRMWWRGEWDKNGSDVSGGRSTPWTHNCRATVKPRAQKR